MKRALLITTTLALLAFIITGCGRRVITGRGDIVSEGRMATSFDKVEIEAPVSATIHVVPGVRSSVELSGYKNLLEHVETTVEGNTLKIRNKDHVNFDMEKGLSAIITVSSLSLLGLHGAADAVVDGAINGDSFTLNITGAGDASIEEVSVKKLSASISGAGDVAIKNGRSSNINYKVSGAGNIRSFGVQGTNVTVKVSGAGDIEVYAAKTLDARVSGAGTIRYKGNPSVKSETSGIGEIVAAN